MKRIILILIGITIFSCSNDEVDSDTTYFSPPIWIQGTWSHEVDGEIQNDVGFKFTNNDFCVINSGVNTQCYNALLKMNEDNGLNVEVDEVSSDNQYKVDIKVVYNTSSYNFVKISDIRFKWVVGEDETIFLKQ